LPIIKNKECSY